MLYCEKWQRGALWNSAKTAIEIRDYTVHNDKQSVAACCPTAHIAAAGSSCWLGCVLTAKQPPRGSNGIKPRPPHLFVMGLSLVDVFHTPQCGCDCVHTCPKEPSQSINASLFWNKGSSRSRCESILKDPVNFSPPRVLETVFHKATHIPACKSLSAFIVVN